MSRFQMVFWPLVVLFWLVAIVVPFMHGQNPDTSCWFFLVGAVGMWFDVIGTARKKQHVNATRN